MSKQLNANAAAFTPPSSGGGGGGQSPTSAGPPSNAPPQPQQPVRGGGGGGSLRAGSAPFQPRGGGPGNSAGFAHHAGGSGGPPSHHGGPGFGGPGSHHGHHAHHGHHGHHHHHGHHGHHHHGHGHGHHHHGMYGHGGHHHGHGHHAHHGHHGHHHHGHGHHHAHHHGAYPPHVNPHGQSSPTVGPMHGHQGHHAHHGHHHGHAHHHHGGPNSMGPRQPTVAPPICVVVLGTMKSGKTTQATKLADKMKYHLIDGSYAAGDEETSFGHLQRIDKEIEEKLKERRGGEPCGFVIDSPLSQFEVEFVYLNSILEKHNMRMDSVIYLEIAMDTAKSRGAEFDTHYKIQHPVAYEVCCKWLSDTETLLHVNADDKRDIQNIYEELYKEINALVPGKRAPFQNHGITLDNDRLPLVRTFDEFLEVQTAIHEATAVSIETFPMSVPSRAMEYPTFVKYAKQLSGYHATYSYDGEYVLVVMYNNKVYLYLHNLSAIYEAQRDATSNAFDALAKEAVPEGESAVRFVFEACAVKVKDVTRIFLTDYLVLNGKLGSQTYFEDRLKDMQDFFNGERDDPYFILSPTVPLGNVEKQLPVSIHADINGLLFIHPGGYRNGTYDKNNFLYRYPDKCTYELRVWNGKEENVTEKGKKTTRWSFEGYSLNMHGEEAVLGEVWIPTDVVEALIINDGNIVECVKVDPKDVPRLPGKPRDRNIFRFAKRRDKKVHPASDYMMHRQGTWQRESLFKACNALPYKRPAPAAK